MATRRQANTKKTLAADTRGDELLTFILLTVVLAPVITVAVVGGYGFLVWMSQIILGPPTG